MTAAATTSSPRTSASDLACWNAVQHFMLRTCGVVLREDQAYLVDARLGGVAKLHGFTRIAAFVTAACASASTTPLAGALIDAMTTHETLFFRDPTFWKFLEVSVFPKLAARTGPVRIWSAACSTGQEPYSIAMLLDEKFPQLAARVEIVATDVSELAVERAKSGTYISIEVNRGLAAARLIRHFDQSCGSYKVREHLRQRITWSVHNLLGIRPDPVNCELVLCRNVLIYFGETDRAAVAKRLLQATAPGGVLGVGSTETLRGTQLAPGLYSRT